MTKSWLICQDLFVLWLNCLLHCMMLFIFLIIIVDWSGSEIIQGTEEADEIDSIHSEWLKKATVYSWIKKFEHEYKTH